MNMIYHLIPVRKAMMTMASAKEDVQKGAPLCTIGGMHIGSATMENDMESLQKNKRWNFNMTQELHFWILKKTKTVTQKDIYKPMFIVAYLQ